MGNLAEKGPYGHLFLHLDNKDSAESDLSLYLASIFYRSIAGRYRPVSYPDGPITARYRFIKNVYWV